jgi:glycosyltransferase domain-containing protein
MPPTTPPFTIFIPTCARPNFLQRILTYYQHFQQPYHIVVADSSPAEYKEKNQQIISTFSDLKITHEASYPPDLNPFLKFADMVKHTQYPYSIICADDDYVDPQGIETAVDFLENHQDFSCAHGNYISFRNPTTTRGRFFWRPIYPYTPLTSDKPQDRFYQHLTDYYQVLYAVRRTKQVQMMYDELVTSTADPMQFGELLPDMLTVLYGKMQRLNIFYGARQIESSVWKWQSLHQYMHQGAYDAEYQKFKACIAAHLTQYGLTHDQADVLIDKAMNQYLQHMKKKEPIRRLQQQAKQLHIPPVLFQYAQQIYGKIVQSQDYINWTDHDPPTHDLPGFTRIKQSVLGTTT